MEGKTRSIQDIIQEQVQNWERRQSEKQAKVRYPTITISRQPGSPGRQLAEALAARLGYEIYHRKLLHAMAESAEISPALLETMDEKRGHFLDRWITKTASEKHLWPEEYRELLRTVILGVGEKGKAIIVGRGANFILPPQGRLRVRIVASRELRIEHLAQEYELSWREAERRVKSEETDRKAFTRKYFQADWEAPENYDLVINMDRIVLDGVVDLVCEAIKRVEVTLQTETSAAAPRLNRGG